MLLNGTKEENMLIIERINKEISALKISEVEECLSNNSPHDESINILICNKFNILLWMLDLTDLHLNIISQSSKI